MPGQFQFAQPKPFPCIVLHLHVLPVAPLAARQPVSHHDLQSISPGRDIQIDLVRDESTRRGGEVPCGREAQVPLAPVHRARLLVQQGNRSLHVHGRLVGLRGVSTELVGQAKINLQIAPVSVRPTEAGHVVVEQHRGLVRRRQVVVWRHQGRQLRHPSRVESVEPRQLGNGDLRFHRWGGIVEHPLQRLVSERDLDPAANLGVDPGLPRHHGGVVLHSDRPECEEPACPAAVVHAQRARAACHGGLLPPSLEITLVELGVGQSLPLLACQIITGGRRTGPHTRCVTRTCLLVALAKVKAGSFSSVAIGKPWAASQHRAQASDGVDRPTRKAHPVGSNPVYLPRDAVPHTLDLQALLQVLHD